MKNKININKLNKKIVITSALWQEFESTKNKFADYTDIIKIVETGIGKVCATANLAPELFNIKKSSDILFVINIGITGSVHYKPGTIIWCTNFEQGDIDIDWFPLKSNIRTNTPIDNSEEFKAIFGEIEKHKCISSDFFTTKEKAKDDKCVYDMETYGQAALCKNLGIPFFALKYVSDECEDSHSAEAWYKIVEIASEAMAEELSTVII